MCRACRAESGKGDDVEFVPIFEKSSKIAEEIFAVAGVKVNKD
jgi:hypothetical protein